MAHPRPRTPRRAPVTTSTPASGAPVVGALRRRLHGEVTKVVVGQPTVTDGLLTELVVAGYLLLEGPPGTAKTLLASTFARALGIDFGRVQFTPDLLPTDVTGTVVLRDGELTFRPGPVFTSVLLADEINRTPPKTQA
ncbi:MAG: AAA family ATPase, partial [Acidimicrobiales bacterium]|nr:AAA family ATPase [Acidimicrobiales bacterium]